MCVDAALTAPLVGRARTPSHLIIYEKDTTRREARASKRQNKTKCLRGTARFEQHAGRAREEGAAREDGREDGTPRADGPQAAGRDGQTAGAHACVKTMLTRDAGASVCDSTLARQRRK